MSIEIEKSLGYNLGTTFFSLGSLLTKNISAENINLTHKQVKLIIFLGHNEGVNQQELACILQKDKPSITKMIDLLEKKDLVVRKADKNDRRNKLLFLTEAGRDTRKELIPIVKKSLAQATEVLTQEENKQLIELLIKVRNNIQSIL